MSQGRLNDFAMLSIEAKLAKRIDFQDIINNFAMKKDAKLSANYTDRKMIIFLTFLATITFVVFVVLLLLNIINE